MLASEEGTRWEVNSIINNGFNPRLQLMPTWDGYKADQDDQEERVQLGLESEFVASLDNLARPCFKRKTKG